MLDFIEFIGRAAFDFLLILLINSLIFGAEATFAPMYLLIYALISISVSALIQITR